MDNEEYKGRAHKPAKNHPWKNQASNKARDWAKEASGIATVNNWKTGGGYKKNK